MVQAGMAPRAKWTIGAKVLLLCASYDLALAIPDIAFPFNSQVPVVARVDQPYLFQFSESTFAPDNSQYLYSLSDQPAWLSIDSNTRTLSGTPGQGDRGAFSFALSAADATGVAHMQCTLVVSTDPAPQLEGDISQQLAATTNLSNSKPPIVTILPSSPFRFDFGPSSFIDTVQRNVYYYATLADHTPLPSWLMFDNQSLTFSGSAPDLSAFPQSWDIDLIASDVVGFAGAAASFTIEISQQQFVFVPEEQTLNITSGEQVTFASLKNRIFRDGINIQPGDLTGAQTISMPPWLKFDPSTLDITGTAPSNASDPTFQVLVSDGLGNTAVATINIISANSSLFEGTIGPLTAYIGQVFTYSIPDDLLRQQNLSLSVTLPATATWLSFDNSNRELQGTVPAKTSPTALIATITAKSSEISSPQSQEFTINIKAIAATSSSSSTVGSPSRSSTSEPSSSDFAAKNSRHHLASGVVAAIVILSVVLAAFLIAVLVWCSRRERRRISGDPMGTPDKENISRPVLAPGYGGIVVTTAVQADVEKIAGQDQHSKTRDEDRPPQIALDWPNANRRSKAWLRTSHISQASSIGNGEDVIRVDSNIPEWGRESAVLQTPHDSFSVPTEIARLSRQASQLSPTKRALRRLRDRRESRYSTGLGVRSGHSTLSPRHSLHRNRSHRRGMSSLGLSAARTQSSQTSLSTRGTSVLSTKEFPRPPARSLYNNSGLAIPTISMTEAERQNTIRLLGRTESVADTRPLAEKRQSFIRNRASTSYHTPLFSHMSKADSGSGVNNRGSIRGSSIASASERRGKPGKSALTMFSESSSLEPHAEDNRRFSARIRSSFAPNFPRAITKSSLGADDEAGDDAGSEYYTTSSSISETDLVAEMALPRHQRSWVLPGEASPTPPPALQASRQPSSVRQSTPTTGNSGPKRKWKERFGDRSASPLSNLPTVSVAERKSAFETGKAVQFRKSVLNEPISLVSSDSLSRGKVERPRLVATRSRRPVSVEDPKRLSSLRAETGTDTDTQAGSEMWESVVEGSGLMTAPVGGTSNAGTTRSNMSGPAFI